MACAGCRSLTPALGATDPADRERALREIARMKGSLRGWLKYRRLNDEIASGKRKGRLPAAAAARIIAREYDWAGEQKLAEQLHDLLSEIYDGSRLPTPNIRTDRSAAIRLAEIAINGLPDSEADAQAQGFLPLLIGAIVLLPIMSFISNRAEVQKEKARLACVQAGGCTDYGFWLKWGAIGLLAVVVYVNREELLRLIKKK